jgi:hypothetical protein
MKFTRPKLTGAEVGRRVKAYFKYIEGDQHTETAIPAAKQKRAKNASEDLVPESVIIYDRQPEPPTLTGLALYIGFNSRQEFEDHEKIPKYAVHLRRARLKIEAEYEKKLHLTSAAGAIFALKSLGWNDDKENGISTLPVLEIKILESGPLLAGTEKEVIL